MQVAITPIDVAANARAFPGKFEGTRPSGQQGLIESYGTAEFILTQDGSPVQLAPGRKATIEIPIYIAKNRDGSAVKEGDVFPLWSLNERTGTWIEEGSGRVVAAASPSGLALRGEVTHFSWWNHDQFLFPIAKPKPRCLVDTNADGILEDLTGTGHCWHAGTGPEQPTPFAPFSAGAGRKLILAEPRTQRIPTWIAEDFTPAAGGKVLLIPADLDITFRSYAKNGTLFGTTVVAARSRRRAGRAHAARAGAGQRRHARDRPALRPAVRGRQPRRGRPVHLRRRSRRQLRPRRFASDLFPARRDGPGPHGCRCVNWPAATSAPMRSRRRSIPPRRTWSRSR